MKRKFEQWRKEPEHVRLRIAFGLTLVSGAIVMLLWGAVLLPLQLYLGSDSGNVAGVTDRAEEPTPTPLPSPIR